MGDAAKRQLDKVGLDVNPRTMTSALTFMQRQMVELAKVLTLEEAVDGNLCVLLDEPTSVLEQAEIDILFGVIRLPTCARSWKPSPRSTCRFFPCCYWS